MRHRSAFTLVELLVVVGIIAILIGVLLPVLARAQAVSRETTCASGLRQLGQGLILYAGENRGALPVEPTEHNPHPGLLVLLRDLLHCPNSIFYCPEAEGMEGYAQNTSYTPVGGVDSVVETPTNVAAGNISYVYFSYLANKKHAGVPWRETAAFIPRLLRVHDAVAADPAKPILDAPPAHRWVLSDFFRKGAPFPHGRRHARGLNVLFLDGHVELMMGRPQENYR